MRASSFTVLRLRRRDFTSERKQIGVEKALASRQIVLSTAPSILEIRENVASANASKLSSL